VVPNFAMSKQLETQSEQKSGYETGKTCDRDFDHLFNNIGNGQ